MGTPMRVRPSGHDRRPFPLGAWPCGAPLSLTCIPDFHTPDSRRRRLAGRPAPVSLAVALPTFASGASPRLRLRLPL